MIWKEIECYITVMTGKKKRERDLLPQVDSPKKEERFEQLIRLLFPKDDLE